MNRVLVVGIPRSGTTWVGHVLGGTAGAVYLGEPDNHLKSPFALRVKRAMGMGDFPALVPGAQAALYEELWDSAFAMTRSEGRSSLESLRGSAASALLDRIPRRDILAASREGSRAGLQIRLAEWLAAPACPISTGTSLVVKSVYAPLCAEWIADRLPIRIVVVDRSPLNVLSSWVKLGWLGRPGDDMLDLLAPAVRDELVGRWGVDAPAPYSSVVARAAWLIGALASALGDAVRRHDGWLLVSHERVCIAPDDEFRALAEALGLPWTEDDGRRLADMNREGAAFEPFRVAEGLEEAWRSRLDHGQVREAIGLLSRFPKFEQLARNVEGEAR